MQQTQAEGSESLARQNSKGRGKADLLTKLAAPGKLFFLFGVCLPVIAVCFECCFHFCAKHFFDPFPSINHVLLFLLIPFSNYLAWLARRKNLSAHYSFMALASGMSMGIGAMYSIMFLPLTIRACLYVGAAGFGLLALAPLLSLPCSWFAGKNVISLASKHKTYFDPHQVEHIGHLIVLVMVLAVELPSTLTRMNLAMAANPASSQKAINWLRRYGSEEVMLRACYERSGRATDIVGSIYEASHPLAVADARKIFYQVTGKPFNTVAIPAGARATIQHANLANDPAGLNAGVEDEFDLDTDIAGETVSGVARGLTVSDSRINGTIYPDALLSNLDWTISFSNSSAYDREARAKIQLPPGAVLTRAILTINKVDHDATIMVREAARAYYQQAVMQHKEDPLLVSVCGPDQVLVQCYPVHPHTETKIRMQIVSPLSMNLEKEAALQLPSFAEQNFPAEPIKVLFTSSKSLSSTCKSLKQNSPKEPEGIFQLEGSVTPSQIASAGAIVAAARTEKCESVFCQDSFANNGQIIERRIQEKQYPLPKKLAVVIDGSVAMKDSLLQIAEGLHSLPSNLPTEIILVCDQTKSLSSGYKNAGAPEFSREMVSLVSYKPEGGHDDSSALLEAIARVAKDDGSVLWIHAAQPMCKSNNSVSLKNLLEQKRSLPLIYDLQVATGPVELLNGQIANWALTRVDRCSELKSDLKRLFASWKANAASKEEFVVHQRSIDSADTATENSSQTDKSLAQLYAYKKIINDLEFADSAKSLEPYSLASTYNLVSPVSSAVVTDPTNEFTRISFKPPVQHDVTEDLINARNSITLALGSFPAWCAQNLNPAATLHHAVSQSFSSITNQLNCLNSVNNQGNRSRQLTEIAFVDAFQNPSAASHSSMRSRFRENSSITPQQQTSAAQYGVPAESSSSSPEGQSAGSGGSANSVDYDTNYGTVGGEVAFRTDAANKPTPPSAANDKFALSEGGEKKVTSPPVAVNLPTMSKARRIAEFGQLNEKSLLKKDLDEGAKIAEETDALKNEAVSNNSGAYLQEAQRDDSTNGMPRACRSIQYDAPSQVWRDTIEKLRILHYWEMVLGKSLINGC